MLGVYSPELTRTLAAALAQLGETRAYVVHGAGGIDELSPCGPNLVCEVENGAVREYELDPRDLGIERCDPSELSGGDPAVNAAGAARRARRRRRRPPLRCDPQRRRRDRGRRPRREPARGDRASRASRSTPAPQRRDSTSSSRSRRRRCPHEVRGRTCTTRTAARSRSSSGARRRWATSARTHASRSSCRSTRRTARAPSPCSSTRGSPARSTTCARRARCPTCRCSRKGFFSTEDHLRELREAGADAALLILRDLDDEQRCAPDALRDRDRARHARRSAHGRRAAARRHLFRHRSSASTPGTSARSASTDRHSSTWSPAQRATIAS